VRRLEWTNALRGVAALSVLAAHFGVTFWIAQDVAAGLARRPALYPGDTGAPRSAKLLNELPLNLGAFGVGLFFLVSGYVIAISLDRYSRRGFLVGRSMRVLPTYAAGYLVTCATIALVGDPQHELHPASVAIGMIPGLQFLTGTTAPGDGIVWTLIIEMVFYLVCLATYRGLTRRWAVIGLVAAGCALIQWLIPGPAVIVGSPAGGARYLLLLAVPFLPVMLVGVTLSARSRGQLAAWPVACLVPVLAGLHFWLLSTSQVVGTSLSYQLTFLGVIASFTAIWVVGHRWRRHRVTDFFADISYPLYVVHPVLGYALLSVLSFHHVRAPIGMLATAVAAIAAAWLLHIAVENPTHRLGQRWARSIGYRPGPPVTRRRQRVHSPKHCL
jgi:peptidoglycan/LPS O-acetylase OafA/YrhL